MSRLVMKFGGTSVANIERIRNVGPARQARGGCGTRRRRRGVGHVGQDERTRRVVSRKPAPLHDAREYDADRRLGRTRHRRPDGDRAAEAWAIRRPLLAGLADPDPRPATAHGVGPHPVDRRLRPRPSASREAREVAVIAGFQGKHEATNRVDDARPRRVRHQRRWLIAAALEADRCDIYTDVDGVYTTDPRIVPKARRHRPGRLRGDAGDGLARRQGAPGALRRGRDGAQGPGFRPLVLRRSGSSPAQER